MANNNIFASALQVALGLNPGVVSEGMVCLLYKEWEAQKGKKGKAVKKQLNKCETKARIETVLYFWEFCSPEDLQWILNEKTNLPEMEWSLVSMYTAEGINTLVAYLGIRKLFRILVKEKATCSEIVRAEETLQKLKQYEEFECVKKPHFPTFSHFQRFLGKQAAEYLNIKLQQKNLSAKLKCQLELTTPRDTNDLVEWGTKLSICFRTSSLTYGERVNDGELNIYGLKHRGELRWVIIMDRESGEFIEMIGEANTVAPVKVHNYMQKLLRNVVTK